MQYANKWWLYAIAIIYLTNLTLGDQPKIVIVGAGTSGIAAASKLYENGFRNITILEAENRIGGRVQSTWFDGGLLELGAQRVHGKTNNVVFELASPYRLLEVPRREDETREVYNSDGYKIRTSISEDFFTLWEDLFERTSDELIGNNGSTGDYYTTRITAEAANFPRVHQTLISEFIKLFEGLANAEDASDSWYNTSTQGYVQHWKCPGDQNLVWKNKPYDTILDILMKKYPNPENELPVLNNTVLNSEVVNIDYNSTEGKVLIQTSNGEQYIADHVIVTPSLGVLKEHYETLFTPQLPEFKVNTIKGLEMGTVEKLFFTFEKAWWPKNTQGFSFLWKESDRQEYENDRRRRWLLNQLGMFTMKQKPLMLRGWVNGPGARYMETLSEEEVINQTFELLQKFLGKSYNITRPTGFLRSTWYSNKHFRGAYSYRSMGTERADVWADDLAAPLVVNGKPIVMFAGEATDSHRYASVHGAIETGFREANRLIDIYNNTLNS